MRLNSPAHFKMGDPGNSWSGLPYAKNRVLRYNEYRVPIASPLGSGDRVLASAKNPEVLTCQCCNLWEPQCLHPEMGSLLLIPPSGWGGAEEEWASFHWSPPGMTLSFRPAGKGRPKCPCCVSCCLCVPTLSGTTSVCGRGCGTEGRKYKGPLSTRGKGKGTGRFPKQPSEILPGGKKVLPPPGGLGGDGSPVLSAVAAGDMRQAQHLCGLQSPHLHQR
jgi:hypothetical protein